jgi:glucose/arabinose dehydrogenase
LSSQTEEAPSSSAVRVEMRSDEAAGRVIVSIRAEGVQLAAGQETPLRRQLEQEELERKYSSPDRPPGTEGSRMQKAPPRAADASSARSPAQRLPRARALMELREGVIALTERAACLEGLASNDPEVRKVNFKECLQEI